MKQLNQYSRKWPGLLVLATLIATGFNARAETPTEAVDRLWNYANQASQHPPTEDESIKFAKQVADEQGTAIIAPIMVRSKDWKGEEVLGFALAVVELPPKKSIPILTWYFLHGQPSEKICANDLLTEIEEWQTEHNVIPAQESDKLLKEWRDATAPH